MQLGVPGASLYYEERGTGPLLLMICGGPTDAGVFAGVAQNLADRYRVVTYDPRGNSRSIADGEPRNQDLDVHGDDAAALIAHVGGAPAFVFGNSGGAQIGLNLTARHPECVKTLIAHEPPCMQLLPDQTQQRAGAAAVLAMFREKGAGPAMALFQAYAGMDRKPASAAIVPKVAPPPEMMATFARIKGNLDFFFAHGMEPLANYIPDVATLRAGKPRVIVGVGETTATEAPHRAALALAEKLGVEAVTFPGDHGGYGPQAPAFAAVLDRVLTG